ncbi:HD superfamily phosphohydrolase [Aequitasia blattaphilus]|uniref:HD domain-containing protein n=1 Tax=Aequitasia blattaphilus TaxID=2949332 RepID=A0ABT1EFB6_9FIRM|nr:HD domain-containing protein [Aequitasia blattaphilus]MCP1103147.1 HD domain-containing protein [Aequitasia blattaphilus]MCR8615787.1 HD domain-containing protein [Aequitasia blattaphilus]
MKRVSTIADTIHGTIEITYFEKKVISHVIFNRMHDVYQNSTVYLTFPCNRTKRFEHSVGTMKLCSDIFYNSFKNADTETINTFLDVFKKSLLELLKNMKETKQAKYEHKFGGRLRKIPIDVIPNKIEYVDKIFNIPQKMKDNSAVYVILMQAIRVVALLHDIGHPPFSHISEFALESIYDNYKTTDEGGKERPREFVQILDAAKKEGTNKKLHELMGDHIVNLILDSVIEDLKAEDAKDCEKYEMQIYEVLIKETVCAIFENKPPFDQLHRIVDGSLDGDRLDYVTRDALNSGLDKGKIEYDRLFSNMTLIEMPLQERREFVFCPNIKALNTVEDYLMRRWDIYKNIIFHHRVVKTDYLMQSVIEKLAIYHMESSGENNAMSELLPSDISGLWKAFKREASLDSIHAISQWDDSWLITVLKKHYFEEFLDDPKNVILHKQLSELLTNQKYYFSAIKRFEDFQIVDKAIAKVVSDNTKKLDEKIDELRKCSTCYYKEELENTEINSEDDFVDIHQFLADIQEIVVQANSIMNKDINQKLIFAKLRRMFNSSSRLFTSKALSDILKELILRSKEEFFKSNEVVDVVCVMKKYDIGVKDPIYLYSARSKSVQNIIDISPIVQILELSYDTFPQFFIYILKAEDARKMIDVDGYLKHVGESIGTFFMDEWMQVMNESIDDMMKEEKRYV